jgi:hypothetical protein
VDANDTAENSSVSRSVDNENSLRLIIRFGLWFRCWESLK